MATKRNGSPWQPDASSFTTVGTNVEYQMDNNYLTIRIPVGEAALANARPSASGKTNVIGTTNGNANVGNANGVSITLGLNLYFKPE